MADFSVEDSHWTKFLRRYISGQTYAVARSAAEATEILDSAVRFVMQGTYGVNKYDIRRKPLYFDTTTLPSTPIKSAVIKQYIVFIAGLERTIRTVNAPLLTDPPALADYGYIFGLTESLGELDAGDMVSEAVNTWVLNAAGRAAINPGGWTKFAWRTIDDINGVAPTASMEGIYLESDTYEQSTLEITYVVAPTVTTNPATDLEAVSATLNGTLDDDGGEACDCGFEWGETVAYGNTTPTQSRTTGQGFSQPISGLATTTRYHFRAFATNWKGTRHGSDRSFITSPAISKAFALAREAL